VRSERTLNFNLLYLRLM